MPVLLLKYLPYIGIVLALAGVEYGVYHYGSKHGEAEIQSKWDHQKAVDAKFVADQKTIIVGQQTVHDANDRKVSDDLAALQTKNAGLVATINGDTALRLQDATRRDSLYRAASEGSATQRANLASYAAELDRSLTEGIGLVDEEQAAIELRDGQIKALASQIMGDHQLINGSGDKTDGQLEPAR